MEEQLYFNFPRRETFFSGRIMIQLKLMFSICRLPVKPPAEQIKLPLKDFGTNPSFSNIIIKKGLGDREQGHL